MSAISKKVKERIAAENEKAPPPVPARPPLTDFQIISCATESQEGDSVVYIAVNLGKFLYVERWGVWMKWAGHFWQKDIGDREATAAVAKVVDEYRRAAAVLRRLLKNDTDDEDYSDGLPTPNPEISAALPTDVSMSDKTIKYHLKELGKKISSLRTNAGRKNVVEYARTSPDDSMVIDGKEMDTSPWLLACNNGVIDLKTGGFRPGRPDDYLTCAAPTEWTGLDTPCPIFEQYFSDILGDNNNLVGYLRRMLGQALIGKQHEHVFLVLAGAKGRNGKDTLMNILSHVLGETVMVPVPSEMLLDQGFAKSSGGPTPDIMLLRGRRLAYASETDEGRKFSSSKVKWLSGGGKLTGRGNYDLEMSSWISSHTLILLTNDLPHAKADDQAFWSRLHLVNFRYSFKPDPDPDNPFEKLIDLDMLDKLKAEASGVLAWLVRGCLEYLREGLKPPQEVTAAAAAYRASEDIIGRFIAECCELKEDAEIQASDLHDAFSFWYAREISRKHVFPKNKFGQLISEKGFSKHKSSVVFWQGLTITEEFNQELCKAESSKGKK